MIAYIIDREKKIVQIGNTIFNIKEATTQVVTMIRNRTIKKACDSVEVESKDMFNAELALNN